MEPAGTVLSHHSLVVLEGRILDILPTDKAREQYTADYRA